MLQSNTYSRGKKHKNIKNYIYLKKYRPLADKKNYIILLNSTAMPLFKLTDITRILGT